ncbi:MAG: hemerythrin [Zoogloeaceae bacterium]|jgi:hemerythrin-like metal-binding protein|nr:hemerythrin [Zoogloeaceae bacterium]
MEWKESYALGHAAMDDTHREFVACVDRLSLAGDAEVVGTLEALIAHTERHFAQESVWMEESRFLPVLCHTEEHAWVLESLKKILVMARNNPGLGRIVARELENWFVRHAATMDAALAAHMKQTGYSPG